MRIAEELPATRVVILTMDSSEKVIREVFRAGTNGFVLKMDAERDLLEVVQSAAENRRLERVARREDLEIDVRFDICIDCKRQCSPRKTRGSGRGIDPARTRRSARRW